MTSGSHCERDGVASREADDLGDLEGRCGADYCERVRCEIEVEVRVQGFEGGVRRDVYLQIWGQ